MDQMDEDLIADAKAAEQRKSGAYFDDYSGLEVPLYVLRINSLWRG